MKTEEIGYKSHHYVPVTYQKRWTEKSQWEQDKQTILMYHKAGKKIISTITKDQAQKKNLYTKTAVIEHIDQKSLEKLLFPIFETSFSKIMENTLDIDELSFSNSQIKGLTNFVFIQSIRSEKEINNTIERQNRMKEKFDDYKSTIESFSDFENEFLTDQKLLLEASILQGLPEFLKRANLTIFIAPKNHNFITSDNPSSIWFKDGLDYILVGSSYPSLSEYDRYFLCPLSPKYCAFVRISTLIDNQIKSDDPDEKIIDKVPYEFVDIDSKNIITINKMIIKASDKILFFSEESDKQYL